VRPYRRENARQRPQHDATPVCIDAFDDLVAEAATGEEGAIAALATGCEHFLFAEARRELGPLYERHAVVALNLFFTDLSQGRLKVPHERGASFFWMKQTARKFAKTLLETRLLRLWREPANQQNEESAPPHRKSAASGL
jgi:hypothetical protein